MENISFYIINGVAEIYILFRYFRTFLGESRVSTHRMLAISSAFLILFVMINTMQEPIINLLASLGLMAGISLFYNGDWPKKLLYIMALLVLNVGLDFVLYQLFMFFQHDMQANFYFHGFISIILRIIVIHIIVLRRKPKEWEIDQKILAIVFVIWGMIIFYALLYAPDIETTENHSFPMHISDIVLMLLSILVFWLFEYSTNKQNVEKQARELALRVEAQQMYYEQFERYEKEIRRHKHDLKNFLYGVIASDEPTRLLMIQEKLGEIEAVGAKQYTEHEAIQILLSTKLEQIEIPNEAIRITCQVPKQLNMENTEIAIMIGNLLDNAVEALERLPFEKRSLLIDIRHAPQYTFISLNNTYDSKHKKVRSRDRGIGQRSVREIVERHEGSYTISTEGEWYRTEIKLPFL